MGWKSNPIRTVLRTKELDVRLFQRTVRKARSRIQNSSSPDCRQTDRGRRLIKILNPADGWKPRRSRFRRNEGNEDGVSSSARKWLSSAEKICRGLSGTGICPEISLTHTRFYIHRPQTMTVQFYSNIHVFSESVTHFNPTRLLTLLRTHIHSLTHEHTDAVGLKWTQESYDSDSNMSCNFKPACTHANTPPHTHTTHTPYQNAVCIQN